jgi:hypothetical protein
LVIAASPASAGPQLSWIRWTTSCNSGGFATCNSVQVLATPTPSGTVIEIALHAPIAFLVWGSWTKRVMDWSYQPPVIETTRGPVGGSNWNGLDSSWETWGPNDRYQRFEMWPFIDWCNPNPVSYIRHLCPATGLTGTFVYTWSLHHRVTAQDLYLEVAALGSPPQGGWACYLPNGAPSPWDCQGVAVTASPEPETWALMVTGLVAFAVIGWRQRWRRR